MLKRDYLLDMIRKASDAIARGLGLVELEKHDEAVAAAEEAMRLLLQLPLDAITQLDVKTALPAISDGNPTAVRLAARGLYIMSMCENHRRRASRSRTLAKRAMELYAAIGIGDDPRDRETALALAAMFRKK